MAASLTGYLNRGWKIFPCHNIVDGHCTCTKGATCENPGKHPRTRNGVKDASGELEQVKAWHDAFPHANWALACGKESGVFVVDVDLREKGDESWVGFISDHLRGEVPDTLEARTGGGGSHLFFEYPRQTDGPRNRVNWLPGVDIRSDGGYVILAPGNHISGGWYAWETDWDKAPAEPPTDLLRALTGGVSGAKRELPPTAEIAAGVPEGARDDFLFREACRLRRLMGDNREMIEAVILTAARRSNPPFPDEDALIKVDQAFKQDHSDSFDDAFTTDDTADDDDPIYNMTDLGNTYRFVRAYGDEVRWIPGMGWRMWSDIGWLPGPEERISRISQRIPNIVRDEALRKDMTDPRLAGQLRSWAKASESRGRISAMVELVKTHSQILKQSDEFDSDPELIACRNGMLNLRDGSIRPFMRDDLFTKNCGVVYDPDFQLPAWDAFLDSATQGDTELQDYLRVAAGYTLTGLSSEECFFIVSGPPASGKSTFQDGLIAAMGTYHDTTPSETFMRKYGGRGAEREEVIKFFGTRIITTSELPEGERFDDSFVKRITGGDTLSARALYQESFSFKPQFKLWMATNHDPVTSDSAMFRRIKRVPFRHSIPADKRDPRLKRLISDPEIGGRAVLAWAARGAREYLEAGKLLVPTSVQMATDEYRGEQDLFTQFLQETVVRMSGVNMRLNELMNRYTGWAKDNNEKGLKRPQFVQKLKEAGLAVSGAGNQDRTVEGIKLRSDISIPFSG